jgi:hypothetical protein
MLVPSAWPITVPAVEAMHCRARAEPSRASLSVSRSPSIPISVSQPKCVPTNFAGSSSTSSRGQLGNEGIAADDSHVYWTSRDAEGPTTYIGRMRTDGTRVAPRLITGNWLWSSIAIGPWGREDC